MSWFPICFKRDLAATEPHRFAIHGQDLVLFLDEKGQPAVLPDCCPHRAARLSDGAVRDGKLECGYHGWQFDARGRCCHIPQLPRDRDCGSRYSLGPRPVVERQGLYWVWQGEGEPDETLEEALIAELDLPQVTSFDFSMDLPYGQPFLVENVIDFAHIHVAHDGTRAGGRRELAAPLSFDVFKESERGFTARYRSANLPDRSRSTTLVDATISFVAPALVLYRSHFRDENRRSGLALYCLPQKRGRSRLLYRAYSSFPSTADVLRPRWLDHMDRCKLIEEDMAIVIGQACRMAEHGGPWHALWQPLDTSDPLVLRARKWLHDEGGDEGRTELPPQALPSRLKMHTGQCSDCLTMLGRCRVWRPRLKLLGFMFLALAIVVQSGASIWALLAVLSALGAELLRRIEIRLVERHDSLDAESLLCS